MGPGGGSGDALARCEVLAALSLATDLGMGQPAEHGLRTCLLAGGLARTIGAPTEVCDAVYDLALLRWIGCTAHAHDLSNWFGDEIAAQRRASQMDFGRPVEVIADLLRHAGEGAGPVDRARTVVGALAAGQRGIHALFASSCEVAANLAPRLGASDTTQDGLGYVFARWGAKGYPAQGGEDIPLVARVLHVVQDATVFLRVGGSKVAREVVRRRSGSAYDPSLADAFLDNAAQLAASLEQPSLWRAVIDADPRACAPLDVAAIDEALAAIGDFADLKTTFTVGHSRGVAELARGAGAGLGLSEDEQLLLQRAGLVHDIGSTGISNAVWDAARPLTEAELEQVRLHPYLTERVLNRSAFLRALGNVAALHHERMDGSGYLRATMGSQLPMTARVLAVADVYQALTQHRPHRSAHSAAEAEEIVRDEVRAGRLDSDAAQAVLAAAGHEVRRRRTRYPAGLTPREVEVLVLVARGLTTRDIAARLCISRKSADHHIQHIYDKIGVRSRAGAAVFAMSHGLTGPLPDA